MELVDNAHNWSDSSVFSWSGSTTTPDLPCHNFQNGPQLDDLFGAFSPSGSGGVCAFADQVDSTGASIRVLNRAQISFRTVVSNIQRAFSLSSSELAKALRVDSRSTIYNWKNGTSMPSRPSVKRIFRLHSLQERLKAEGIQLTKAQVHRPLRNGLSIGKMLEEQKINEDAIFFEASQLSLSDSSTLLRDPF